MYSHLSVGLFWFVLFQLRGLKERIPPLQGATLQLLGQALCGGSPSLCFYLQQWQRSCRKRNHKLIHSSGGIQWGSTGNGKGQSESYCLFTHTAGTLQVVVHPYHPVCHLWSEENAPVSWRMSGIWWFCPQSSQFVQGFLCFGHSWTRNWNWLLLHTVFAFMNVCWYHHPVCLGFVVSSVWCFGVVWVFLFA